MADAEDRERPDADRKGETSAEARLSHILRRVGRWMSRLDQLWRWVAGVAAAVVVTVLTAWLVAWGLLPDGRPDPETGGLPFTVAVNAGQASTNGWISDQPLSGVPVRPAYGGDWGEWASRAAAVPADYQSVYFTVQGRSEAQVTLTDLRVRVVERRPAIGGTVFNTGGGDLGSYRWVSANLDEEPPALESGTQDFLEDAVPPHERRPMRFPYRVSISDAETFVVDAYTKDCYCFWVIELDWASQGRVGTLVIADRGDPFRLTGSSNATQICTVLGPDGPEECRTSP